MQLLRTKRKQYIVNRDENQTISITDLKGNPIDIKSFLLNMGGLDNILSKCIEVEKDYIDSIKKQSEEDKKNFFERKEEQEKKLKQNYFTLIQSNPIPATLENIRIILKYYNTMNWGEWNDVPKFTLKDTKYQMLQYDCEGKQATAIKLTNPISDGQLFTTETRTKFVVGAPLHFLENYIHIR